MSHCVVYQRRPALPAGVIERASKLPTSVISDSFDRWSGTTGILPVDPDFSESVAGTALTVRTRPGDNLVVHKALDIARPGDVLVIAAGGEVDRAILGALMAAYAKSRGIAALVVDGAVRDRADLRKLGLPVYARSVNQLGPYKSGPGELHGEVSAGGLVVRDGHLVVADGDGVTAVASQGIEEILSAAEARAASEKADVAAIESGTWDRTWIDEAITFTHVDQAAPGW